MLLLDTNVASEMMRSEPDAAVLAWFDAQHAPSLFLSSVVLAELRSGIAMLPAGRRRKALEQLLDEGWLPRFGDRLLVFDAEDARHYAAALTAARRAGNTMEFADAALAGQAMRHGASLVTRNTKDFKGCDIALINPWAGPAAKAPKAR